MTTTLHRIKVPVTDEQRAVVHAVHDPSTPEGAIARAIIGNVPTSDGALLAALITYTLNEIERQAEQTRLDAAYADLAEAMAEEADERRADSALAMAALNYAIGADDTE